MLFVVLESLFDVPPLCLRRFKEVVGVVLDTPCVSLILFRPIVEVNTFVANFPFVNIVLKGKKIAVLVVLEINRFYDFMCTIVIEGHSGYSSRVVRVCNVVHARTKRVHRRAVVVFCPVGYDLSVADYAYLLESIFRIIAVR